MQEFHIYICDALNKNKEKLDITDKEALTAYREFYKAFQSFNLDTTNSKYQTFSHYYLTDLYGKEITYPYYLNISDKPFNPDLWGLQLTPNEDWIWYMNQEIKDDLIKCAENHKIDTQKSIDYLRCNYTNKDIYYENLINNFEIEIDDCNTLIEKLNYYYDRRMLLFLIFLRIK